MQCPWRSNNEKMRPFGVKPLTWKRLNMVKSGSLDTHEISSRPNAPLRAEGKEFLLTAARAISYEYLYRVWFQCAILYSFPVRQQT